MNIKKLNLNFKFKSPLEAYLFTKSVGKRLILIFSVTSIIYCIATAVQKTKSGGDVQAAKVIKTKVK